jgi:phenylpropionate dioxygenase-like ring-hydroxylating dioxygenase large terminal subunit
MARAMENEQIAQATRAGVRHGLAGTFELAPTIQTVAAEEYISPVRFERERTGLFRRIPLLMAASAEMRNAGDYKTSVVAGVPVLLVRGSDAVVRGFINGCAHRGAIVATPASGNARRFTCPYHGWTYGEKGELLAVASAHDFGEIDRNKHGLKPLPVVERAGLIFGILDAKSQLDIDVFLANFDKMLQAFNFQNWHFFGSKAFAGPNWKLAFDGYLDYYHLPVLHKNTFGRGGVSLGNRALYHSWGPHQRLVPPDRAANALGHLPEAEWSDRYALIGVWAIFPGVAIASFDGGGRGVMISQVLPGDHVGQSTTRLTYLMEKPPSAEQQQAAIEQFDFLETVVLTEDYATGLGQQRALAAGALEHVMFGQNESGAPRFHAWVDRILDTDDANLTALFTLKS